MATLVVVPAGSIPDQRLQHTTAECSKHGPKQFNRHGICPDCFMEARGQFRTPRTPRVSPVQVEMMVLGRPMERVECPAHGSVCLNRRGECPKCFNEAMEAGFAAYHAERADRDMQGSGVQIEAKQPEPVLPVTFKPVAPSPEISTIVESGISQEKLEPEKPDLEMLAHEMALLQGHSVVIHEPDDPFVEEPEQPAKRRRSRKR